MKQTVNLKLNKPDTGDPVLISDLNENADILDTAVSNKLDKIGAVVDYTADPKQMQVRNSKIADAKPADSEGKDGDMVFIPGSSTIDPSILDGKLDDSQLVTAWSDAPSDSKIPSEKLVKDSLDNAKVEVVQNADGITVGGTKLQTGTRNQPGVMSRNRAIFCKGTKQRLTKLTATDDYFGIDLMSEDYDEDKDEIATSGIRVTIPLVNSTDPHLNEGRPLPGVVTPDQWDSKADASALDGKLDKAGDTMTGKLTVGQASMDTNGYVEGTWLRTTKATNNASVPDEVAVLVNGWIYYVTKAQLISALGIDQCALKSDISAVYKAKGSCTTAELASKAKETGDVWNLTDAGQYGPAGTNVLWTGTEWDALSGIVDLSSYAKKSEIPDISTKADKSEIPDISGKADKSEIPDISGKLDKSGGTMTGPITLAGGDGKGINIPQDGTINGPGTATLFGFLSNVFTLGSSTWPTSIRGQGARPTYNNAEMALRNDIPDVPDVSNKLDDTGGAMTSYLADKTALQVRNVMTATEKPADTVGQDGDICFVIKA